MCSPPLKLSTSLLATVAVALSSGDAFARGPVGVEVGAEAGYGTSPGGAAVNPLGLGVGGRAGLTLWGLYLGVEGVNYFGSPDGNGGQYHAVQFGGQLGYRIKISSVTIRPQVGVGDVYLFGSSAGVTSPALPTALCLYTQPGAVVFASFGALYVGVDASALLIVNEPAYVLSGSQYVFSTSLTVAFTAHGQIGLKF